MSIADLAGGPAKPVMTGIDRDLGGVIWRPDGKALLVGGNDSTRVSMWIQPLQGAAKKIQAGDRSPNSTGHIDRAVSKDGAIAFVATSPTRPAELYYMASADAPVKRLIEVNAETANLPLGRSEAPGPTPNRQTSPRLGCPPGR